MSRRSLFAFIASAFIAVATTGCPSPNTVSVKDPIEEPTPDPIKNEPKKQLTLRQTLAANRARHLDQLNAYWKAQEFPVNRDQPVIANVFRDDEGHLCAVANMISKDGGFDKVIDEQVKKDNFIRLADVHEGTLYEWILTSGFTQEEVAMIQVPYMPARQVNLDEEKQRIAERLADVEERLRDDTEQSLNVATTRYIRYRDVASIRWSSN